MPSGFVPRFHKIPDESQTNPTEFVPTCKLSIMRTQLLLLVLLAISVTSDVNQVSMEAGAVAKAAASPAAVIISTSKNVGVSEKVLDGHIDDVVWATKDGLVLFVVSRAYI
jgi:hypothetical protein